jgi:hypothetical protein
MPDDLTTSLSLTTHLPGASIAQLCFSLFAFFGFPSNFLQDIIA